MPGPFSRLRRCSRGSSAVEFGLIAPLLLLLLGGLVDLGAAMHRTIGLQNAARAGAQHAMSFPDDTPGIAAATVAAMGGATGTVSVTEAYCACPGSAGARTSCEGTPCDGAAAGRYVEIRANRGSETIVGIGSLVLPATLSGTATARVR